MDPTNKEKIEALEVQIKMARMQGALFHPTNPVDSWYCPCGVFGKGQNDEECWACGSTNLYFQWIPRFGGGAQCSGLFEEES